MWKDAVRSTGVCLKNSFREGGLPLCLRVRRRRPVVFLQFSVVFPDSGKVAARQKLAANVKNVWLAIVVQRRSILWNCIEKRVSG